MKRLIFIIITVHLLSYIWASQRTKLYPAAKPPLVNIRNVIPDAAVDVRYATKNNFTGRVLDGYKKPYCWVRPKTALALKKVQRYLKKYGLGLKFFDCYRPLRAVKHMIRWTRKNRPSWLGIYVGRRVDLKVKFGHSCGNAVDVSLISTKTKKEINMGSAFDDFSKKSWTKNAKGRIFKMRMILYNAMRRYGFENFYSEWWHYTYKGEAANILDIIIE